VELGHQVVVLPLFVALLPFRRRASARGLAIPPITRFASAAVSCAGMYYFVAAVR